MKNKLNIEWWDFEVPSLENWRPQHLSNLDSADKRYLEDLKQDETFYSELGGQTSASDLLIIKAIAEQTHRRILQKYHIKDTVYWPWIVTSLAVVLVILFLSVFNFNSQKTKEQVAQKESNQKAQSNLMAAADKNEPIKENSMMVHERLEIGAEEKTSSKVVIGNEKINTENNLTDIDTDKSKLEEASKKVSDVAMEQVGTAKKEGSSGPDPVSDAAKKDKTKKKKNYGERFKSQAASHGAKSRDVTIPLTVSSVRVEQAANYAVYLNSATKKSSTKDGQIAGGESADQTRVKFAPEDMPQYPGNNDRLESDLEYLIAKFALNKSYDEIVSVMVSFIIDAKGAMKDVKINGYKTQEIRSSIQKSLAELDSWKKGKKSGKKGSVRYEILISYK